MTVGFDDRLNSFFIRGVTLIRDKLHQGSIGIAKIHAHALPFHARSNSRTDLDRYALRLKVRNRFLDRPWPLKTQITAASRDRNPCVRIARLSRAMHVQLLVSKTIGPPVRKRDKLGAKNVAIETIRALPVGDRDDAVIKLRLHRFRLTLQMSRSWLA